MGVLRTIFKGLGYSVGLGVPGGAAIWYGVIASDDQKVCTKAVLGNMPVMLEGGLIRASRPALSGVLVGIDYKYSLWGLDDQSDQYQEVMSSVHSRTASRLLDVCLENGGLYIKFGQGLVSMGHVLPKEYVETLKVLQDQALKRTRNDEVEEIFNKDFGKSHKEIFTEFSEHPIAAASLAQVFKARTQEGDEVAVKVQYIDLRDRFESDVTTMDSVLNMIQIIHPQFAFKWVLKELKGTLENELDFLKEAKNSEECAKDLENFKYLYVPKLFRNLSSHRVLTTEFIDGIKVTEGKEIESRGMSLAEIDRNLLRVFSEQIFHTGFVHADPHPGNILIRKVDNKSQIVLLDHGLYERLPTNERSALCGLWVAVVQNDYPNMKRFGKELNVDDYRLFAMALTQRYVKPTKEELKTDILAQFMDRKGPKRFDRKAFNSLPDEEKEKIRASIRDFHDRMFDVMQKMPSRMMLIMRNLNQIRSIIKEHGTGVERYREMARVAVSGRLGGGIRGYVAQVTFDMRLSWDWLKTKMFKLGFSIALKLGYLPDILPELQDQT